MAYVTEARRGDSHGRTRDSVCAPTEQYRAIAGQHRDLSGGHDPRDARRTSPQGTGPASRAARPRPLGRPLGYRPAWLHPTIGGLAALVRARAVVLSPLLGGRPGRLPP